MLVQRGKGCQYSAPCTPNPWACQRFLCDRRMTLPPASPPAAPQPAGPREATEVLIAGLRAEVEATPDRTRQALLLYEIGHLCEHGLSNDAMAVKEYLAAYNLDASFRPPLFDLVRIFERRLSFKNLLRLYETEQRTAGSAIDGASALVDRGALLEDHLANPAEGRRSYEEALELDASSLAAALMLERAARAKGDAEAVERVVALRAARAKDPVLQGLLLAESAQHKEARGEVDGAVADVQKAAALEAGRWRWLGELERIARRHGRMADLVQALEGRAALADGQAVSDEAAMAGSTFAAPLPASEEEARDRAAALWYEAARLRLAHLGDAEGAMAGLERALALRPDDGLLRQEHMLACELAGAIDKVAEDAQALLAGGAEGPFAAAQHFRLAEVALAREDMNGARAALTAALEADPRSPAAMALLDDLLLESGLHDDRLDRLEERGESSEGEALASRLWRAAQIAVEQVGDFDRGRDLYRRAAAAAADPVPILRELYGAARRRDAKEALWEAVLALLERDLDGEERSALLHDLIMRGEDGPDEHTSRVALLERALSDPACARWAPDVARLHAAWHGNAALLARSHAVLADAAGTDEGAAAHLCAAARALMHGGQAEQAMHTLRQALERVRGHRYAVGMLEELLRASGQAEAVVDLLREAAAAHEGAEMTLLLAGAAAEAAGDVALAARTYEDAAGQDPTAIAPLWSVRRLAERHGDATLLGRSLEALSEREVAAGEPGRATLELGEHRLLVQDDPERAATALQAALEGADAAEAAALDVHLLPLQGLDLRLRIDAAERLVRVASEASRGPLLRELASTLLVDGADAARANEVAERLAETDGGAAPAAWLRLRAAGVDAASAEARAHAWVALGETTTDRQAAADLLLHGLRARTVLEGGDADEDAFLLAHSLTEEQPDAAAAAVAMDETLGGGDDPEARADSLAARLERAGKDGRAALEAAHGRALVAAGRHEEALAVLRAVVANDDTDLASWDCLRVAARDQRAWRDVVRACDRLAAAVQGPMRAQLLEEGAALLMDELGDDPGAEKRLRGALEVNRARPIAYGRLHDLLAEREDTAALLELVTGRIDAVDEPAELEKLYYEQARLRRAGGDRDGALASLESLLLLDDKHVGGLALAVEVHVSLERWSEAVERLRQLAGADVPAKQKRLAHLGAADFLQGRLGDGAGALTELRSVEALGMADAAVYARMAEVAEQLGQTVDALAALDKGIEQSKGAERARLARRAGDLRIHRAGDRQGAMACYRLALSDAPEDLASGEALVSLLDDVEARRAVSLAFEQAVRAHVLDANPSDADGMRKLARAAAWRGDRDLQRVCLATLVALGAATDEERQADQERTEITERTLPRGTLTEQAYPRLRNPGDRGPVRELARLAFEAFAQLEGTEPAVHGVHKNQRVNPRDAHAVRDEMFILAQVFNVPPGDFYAGGTPDLIALLPSRADRPTWIAGPRVRSPLDPRDRFEVGRLAMAFAEGTLPLLGRPAGQAVTMLMAAAMASGVDLPAAGRRPGVQEMAPDLGRVLSRRARRAIAELADRLPNDAQAFETYVLAARRSALRAGLLVAGDVGMALWAVLGEPPDMDAVRASDDALDMVRFWTSGDAAALRRALGMTA
jgi:lipopolysaccharide biosynthesis regulator YciM